MTDDAKVPLTETPEFQAALDARFETLRASLLKDLSVRDVGGGITKADLAEMFTDQARANALATAEVADQGTQRKRVPPAELEERRLAFERMGSLISQAQSLPQKDWPRYGLKAKVELANRVIDPYRRNAKNDIEPIEILHIGMPNVAMRPINAVAKGIFSEFIRYLGGSKEANQIAAPQPVWMTTKGTLIAGAAPSTVKNIGGEFTPDPIVIDGEEQFLTQMPGSQPPQSIVSTTDPRATAIPVLGSIAEPARVGSTAPRTI